MQFLFWYHSNKFAAKYLDVLIDPSSAVSLIPRWSPTCLSPPPPPFSRSCSCQETRGRAFWFARYFHQRRHIHRHEFMSDPTGSFVGVFFAWTNIYLVTFDILRPWPMLHQVRSSEVPHSASSLTLGSKMGWLLNDRWYFSDKLSDVQINIGSSLNIIIIILILCWSSTWIDHEETLCGFELNQSLEQAWYFRSDPSFFFYKKNILLISGNVKRKGSRH